ncbi:MAG TPA: hypothetical protein VJL31_05350 [Gemmatimonadales bacterium]|jgi:hypothetical protein|nr:hypothetical protein [Gemmatimonadales bacterium]
MPDQRPDLGSHPKGTLAIVGLYGVLFALGWLAFFFFIYLPRGAVSP